MAPRSSRATPVVLRSGLLVAACIALGACAADPSPSGASRSGADEVGGHEPAQALSGRMTLQPGIRYLAEEFSPPIAIKPDAEWEAVVHDGRDGRNVGEFTVRREGAVLHFEQPDVSDAGGGIRVEAPTTIPDFITALRTVPGIAIQGEQRLELGETDAVRMDVTLTGIVGSWPDAIRGVDELCIGPAGVVTRFYVLQLDGKLFLGLPPCQPTMSNDEYSAIVEPLLDTITSLGED